MLLVTFLDDAPYPPTTFAWQEQRFHGRFAPAASARFLQPDGLLVFQTEQARERIFPALQAELPHGLPLRSEIIPPGANQVELWQIARHVAGAVGKEKDVSFDISHGPLCYPLVGLMTAVFLRATRSARLGPVLYAAYGIDIDEKSPSNPNETPMFDLNEMMIWIQWFQAVDRFTRMGEAHGLADLIQEEQGKLAQAASGDARRLAQISGLGKLAGVINGISNALYMIRPQQVIRYAADLPERIRSVQPLLDDNPTGLGYSLVMDQVIASYAPLEMPPDEPSDSPRTRLQTERNLINWYGERELWVEAATLAREWLVSWAMFQLDLHDFTRLNYRQRVEGVLSSEAHDLLFARQKHLPYQPIFLRNLPQVETLLALWLDVTEARNDINHAGMRERPGRPEDLMDRLRGCIHTLNTLTV
jgi:hypothetical protein